MKHLHLIVIGLLLATAQSASFAADAKPVVAGSASSTVATNESLRVKNAALMEQATRDQEETHRRNLELIARTERNIGRQEKDMARFEKILDTWDRQQAQYQKYLDSLPAARPATR